MIIGYGSVGERDDDGDGFGDGAYARSGNCDMEIIRWFHYDYGHKHGKSQAGLRETDLVTYDYILWKLLR